MSWQSVTREFEWHCGGHVGDRWERPEGGLDGAGRAVRQKMRPSEVRVSLRRLRLRERGHAARPAAGAAVQPNCAGERPLQRIPRQRECGRSEQRERQETRTVEER